MNANANDCQYGKYLKWQEVDWEAWRIIAQAGSGGVAAGATKKSAPGSILDAGAVSRGGTRILGTLGDSLRTHC